MTDATGSVRAVANADGELVSTADSTAFGEALGAGSVGVFGFAGEYTDPNGLVHLRARPYGPGSGRFLAVDPVQPGSPGTTGWQYYAYAGNNPTTWTDPSGSTTAISYNEVLVIGAATAAAALATGMALANAIDMTDAEIDKEFLCLVVGCTGDAPNRDDDDRVKPDPSPRPVGPRDPLPPLSCSTLFPEAVRIVLAESLAIQALSLRELANVGSQNTALLATCNRTIPKPVPKIYSAGQPNLKGPQTTVPNYGPVFAPGLHAEAKLLAKRLPFEERLALAARRWCESTSARSREMCTISLMRIVAKPCSAGRRRETLREPTKKW